MNSDNENDFARSLAEDYYRIYEKVIRAVERASLYFDDDEMDTLPDMLSEITGAKLYAEFASKMFDEMLVNNLRDDDKLFDRTYRSRLSHVQEDEYWEKYDNLKQPISEKA